MAYTSVIPVYRLDNAVRYAQDKQKTTRQHGMPLAETVDYALNREKTETDGFESGLGCTTQSAYEDMRANAVRWHKTDGVQGYHLVQSFAEGEVTPELAHKIGLELAERVLGGRHQAIVTTHLNTSHYHNHIVWSSVAMNSGRKYHSNAKSYALEIRAVSDELCVKYGLSIIQTERAAQVSKPYAEWLAEKNGQPTWRTVIRQDVDAALAEALTWRQFIRELESKGYELNFNHKYPTLRPPGKTRPVRFKTLGRQYTSEALQIRILYPDARWHFLQEQPPVAKHARLRKSYGKARRLTGLRALYYRYLYELGALPHKPRRPSYAVRQDIRNLDRRIRQMEFLSANSIDSIEQLQAKQIALENKIAELQTERQRLYRTAPNSPEIPAITAALKPLRRDLEARLDELREILWDMNEVSYTTREETVEVSAQNANTEASRDTASESTANDSGARSQESNEADTTTITQTVLTIHLTHKTPEEMQTAYNFTARQAEYLTLLQDPKYETLWAELLGGFAAGDSEILTPDTTRTPTGSLQWPLPIPGSITSPFGYRTDPLTGETSYHDGTDIAAPEGTPILAAADGTVTVANALDSWGGSYGYYVQIDHGSGLQTLYAHCCQVCVTQGQQVQARQVIAYVGHTGRATGNHLHFEVRENGERVDAMRFYS